MSWRKDQAHYQALKAQGRCVECAIKKLPGVETVRCAACNDKRREQRRKWQAAGLCRTCGQPVNEDRSRCPRCLADQQRSRAEQGGYRPRAYVKQLRKAGTRDGREEA